MMAIQTQWSTTLHCKLGLINCTRSLLTTYSIFILVGQHGIEETQPATGPDIITEMLVVSDAHAAHSFILN